MCLSDVDLWWVLSALRGPDTDEDYGMLKGATTAVIRHKIGLKDESDDGDTCYPFTVHGDSALYLDVRLKNSYSNTDEWKIPHFIRHAKAAFMVLGLKWEEVNE